jgi:uracil-DNA glycosylase family 4
MDPIDLWNQLNARITACRRCPRLRQYCAQVAVEKRAAFRDQQYWGKPVPNFGDANGRLLVVGLAPAAHGANRTGRMFTGDRSGDFLFEALHATGFANQPTSVNAGDGLALRDMAITAIAHCAPPDNKPLPEEMEHCADYLRQTFELMRNLRGIVALGKIGFDGVMRMYRQRGWTQTKASEMKFGHGSLYRFGDRPFVLCTYHPSQQNTFTGKLTQPMLREVFEKARWLVEA